MKRLLYKALQSIILFAPVFLQAQTGQWAWVSGDTVNLSQGRFGIKNTASLYNRPPALGSCSRWIDQDDNLWLFGGSNSFGAYNTLWKFDVKQNLWVWIRGDSMPNSQSVYGIKGVADSKNMPSARTSGACWTDKAGNFWLFGGGSLDTNGTPCRLNDLWKFDVKNLQWTWMSGETIPNSMGHYGPLGQESDNYTPPAKEPVTGEFVDGNGNLWLYSGYNHYEFASVHELWRFNVQTGKWAFISGIPTYNTPDVTAPKYGPQGTFSNTYHPGARNYFCAWSKDTAFYLFSGDTYRSSVADFWEYHINDNSWAWTGGGFGRLGIHDQLCTQSPLDFPSARVAPSFCQTRCNGFFLYGGLNYQSHHMSDFWYYNPLTRIWTCLYGDDTSAYSDARYGIKNVPDPLNTPGSRAVSAMWVDKKGNVWLFGGQHKFFPNYMFEINNDLWKYTIDWNCLGDSLVGECAIHKPTEPEPEELYIPNVFTPNGDHMNDTFTIKVKGISIGEALVYNRWGECIYRDKGKVAWDGAAYPDGTYYYIITLKRPGRSAQKVNGVVTLVR